MKETKSGLRLSEMVPGTKVRLTGAFLKSTGQVAGGEGSSVWTLVPCSCDLCARNNEKLGYFVAVNEPRYDSEGPRHFNAANLEAVRAKPRAMNYP